MSTFDFSTLIIDRTSADVTAVSELVSKIVAGTATEEEIALFNAAAMKGAYNYTDLNRVTAAMEYLDETLRSYGYVTGYQRLKVPHASSLLPDGYTQVAYIQSSGTQYIDTGFRPNQNTRMICKIRRSENSTSEGFFGCRTSTSAEQFNCYVYSSGWRSGYNNSIGTSSTSPPTDQDIEIDKNKNLLYVNGNLLISSTYASFNCNYSAFIFAHNLAGTPEYGAYKLFSFKIYDDGTLVRDYIPCIDPDGTVGLYDLVNSVFYASAGTEAFTAGPMINLPSGYNGIEYLESTGTQYIDVGFKPNQNTRAIIDCELLETGKAYGIFGARISYGNAGFDIFAYGASSKNFQDDFGVEHWESLETLPGRWLIDKNKNVTMINDDSHTFSYSDFQLQYNAFLFGISTSGSPNNQLGSLRIYSCKIYDNGTLIRDYVPCTNADGMAGLYDLVNGVFYSNAGSGTFTAGKEASTGGNTADYDDYTWYENDAPTKNQMARYLANVLAIYNTILTEPELPETMAKLNYNGANKIEQALALIWDAIQRMELSFFYSGELYCGEV